MTWRDFIPATIGFCVGLLLGAVTMPNPLPVTATPVPAPTILTIGPIKHDCHVVRILVSRERPLQLQIQEEPQLTRLWLMDAGRVDIQCVLDGGSGGRK